MPGGDLYDLAGAQVPGAAVLIGGFRMAGGGGVIEHYPNVGRRFTVTLGVSGEFKVTLDHGAFKGVYAVLAHMEHLAANSNRRVLVKDSSQLTVDGSFIVTHQFPVGSDSYGNPNNPRIWLWACLQQTSVAT